MGLGSSLKKVVKSVLPAASAAVGAYFGGPTGAASGYQVGKALNGGEGGIEESFVNGAVGLGQDNLAAQQQWQYSKMASDYAFNQNLKMWNMQNAYNDPSAQMARLKAAGLNPNLVYGGGNVTGNTSGSAPQYDTPKVSFEDRSIQRQQMRLALAEHQQSISNQAIENDLARQRLVLQEREADRNDALAQAQIAAYKANLGMIDANIGNIASQEDYRKRSLAQTQYNADLKRYYDRVDRYARRRSLMSDGEFERLILKEVGRRPMLMDYLK